MATTTSVKETQVDKMTKDVEVVESETLKEITIPKGMSPRKAAQWLIKKADEAEAFVAVSEPVIGFSLDAAHAFSLAIKEIYGFSEKVPTPGFFGPTPPQFISVIVDAAGTTRDVYVGMTVLPGIEGSLQVQPTPNGIAISGEVKQKHVIKVKELAARTRELLKTKSLLRGKSFRISFAPPKKGEQFNLPTFIQPATGTAPLLNPHILREVQASVWTPMEHTEECRNLSIPLKRGVLLAGPYGTGKTLTMSYTAGVANKHGWTYIYLTDVREIAKGYELAAQLAPCVIAAEDLDLVGNSEEVRNIMDAIHTKNLEIIVVLTTNHVEKLDMALRRPGRLDNVIPFEAPDAVTASKIVKLYARDLLANEVDLSAIGEKLAGRIPAVIREIVERAKTPLDLGWIGRQARYGRNSQRGDQDGISSQTAAKRIRWSRRQRNA